MIESEIQELEATLNKRLPVSYRNILLNYPRELTLKGNLAEPISALVLPEKLTKLLELAVQFKKWLSQSNKIVIGEDGCGGYFFIDISNEKIYELDHENPKFLDGDEKLLDFESSLCVAHNNIKEYIEFHLSVY